MKKRPNLDHVSVCICTYKRPEMLGRALKRVNKQILQDPITFEIIIVDNDINRSAERITKAIQKISDKNFLYDCEPVKSISLARNRCIRNSTGNYIAFIDDDEFPEPTWLQTLFTACEKYHVDGVLGPVIPFYAIDPPTWLVKSGLCVRSQFPTGTLLNDPKFMRTGNVLFKKYILDSDEEPFDNNFGLSGGEDAVFFARKVASGYTFAWCNEARVYEEVTEDRQTFKYHLQRSIMRGVTSADDNCLFSKDTMKSLCAVVLYAISLPVLLFCGYHLFIKYVIKLFDHLSKILARCGIFISHERSF